MVEQFHTPHLTMKKRPCRLQCEKDSEPYEVWCLEAEYFGNFTVHLSNILPEKIVKVSGGRRGAEATEIITWRKPPKLYTVTHQPSGVCIVNCVKWKSHCVKIAKALNDAIGEGPTTAVLSRAELRGLFSLKQFHALNRYNVEIRLADKASDIDINEICKELKE